MVIQNQKISLLTRHDIATDTSFHLINCFIETIDLIGTFRLGVHLRIENCIVNNLKIHSCWFENGLVIKGSIIENAVDYQMGGHNQQPLFIIGNIFGGFFNFFDCQFEGVVEVRENIFNEGTNLLGYKGKGFANTFKNGWIVENNLGDMALNE